MSSESTSSFQLLPPEIIAKLFLDDKKRLKPEFAALRLVNHALREQLDSCVGSLKPRCPPSWVHRPEIRSRLDDLAVFFDNLTTLSSPADIVEVYLKTAQVLRKLREHCPALRQKHKAFCDGCASLQLETLGYLTLPATAEACEAQQAAQHAAAARQRVASRPKCEPWLVRNEKVAEMGHNHNSSVTGAASVVTTNATPAFQFSFPDDGTSRFSATPIGNTSAAVATSSQAAASANWQPSSSNQQTAPANNQNNPTIGQNNAASSSAPTAAQAFQAPVFAATVASLTAQLAPQIASAASTTGGWPLPAELAAAAAGVDYSNGPPWGGNPPRMEWGSNLAAAGWPEDNYRPETRKSPFTALQRAVKIAHALCTAARSFGQTTHAGRRSEFVACPMDSIDEQLQSMAAPQSQWNQSGMLKYSDLLFQLGPLTRGFDADVVGMLETVVQRTQHDFVRSTLKVLSSGLLPRLKSLQELDLDKLTTFDDAMLCETLACVPSIERLHLPDCTTSKAAGPLLTAEGVSRALHSVRKLTDLKIASAFEALLPALRERVQLTRLDAACRVVARNELAMDWQPLFSLTGLQSLTLRGVMLDARAAKQLAQLSRLTELAFARLSFWSWPSNVPSTPLLTPSAAAATAVAKEEAAARTITAIVAAATQLPQLRRLCFDADWCQHRNEMWHGDGMHSTWHANMYMPEPQLGLMAFKDDHMRELARATQLHDVWLAETQVTDNGVATLLQGLKHLTQLQIASEDITGKGFHELSTLSSLKRLDLSHCPQLNLLTTLQNVSKLRGLTWIDVSQRSFQDPPEVQKIIEVLQKRDVHVVASCDDDDIDFAGDQDAHYEHFGYGDGDYYDDYDGGMSEDDIDEEAFYAEHYML